MGLRVVLFDCVNRNLLRKVKVAFARQGLQVICSKRSAGQLRRRIGGLRHSTSQQLAVEARVGSLHD